MAALPSPHPQPTPWSTASTPASRTPCLRRPGQHLAGDPRGAGLLAGIESDLSTLAGEAELLLEPVARELVVVRPIGFEPLRWVRALAAEEPVPTARAS